MAGEFISVKGQNYGQLGMTKAIRDIVESDIRFETDVRLCTGRYAFDDWGDIEPEGKEANENALQCGNLKLLAKYATSQGDIYFITEGDRSSTMILFCHEYQEQKAD